MKLKCKRDKKDIPIITSHCYIPPRVGEELDDYEQALNYMARAILIPLKSFTEDYKVAVKYKYPKELFIMEMCLKYGVDEYLIRLRIDDIKYLKQH